MIVCHDAGQWQVSAAPHQPRDHEVKQPIHLQPFCSCTNIAFSLSTCNEGVTGDTGSIVDPEDPLEEGMATPFQYSCLKSPTTEEPDGYSPWVAELDMTEAT